MIARTCRRLLQEEVEALLSAGVNRVALNMRLVKFINSTALGSIIKISKALGANGGRLAISRPSAFCRDIMEKVGLNRVVPILDSDEEAGSFLTSTDKAEASGKGGDALSDDSSVLFSLQDEERVDHFIPASARSGSKNPVHGHSYGWRAVSFL